MTEFIQIFLNISAHFFGTIAFVLLTGAALVTLAVALGVMGI